MRNIHIALVGGQPVPVYIGINYDIEATLIVLVCSEQSKEEADRLKMQFPDTEVRIEECSPVDLKKIEQVAAKLSKEFKNDSVTLNLTSGTKLWTIVFFRDFTTNTNTEFIYVDQNNIITNIQTRISTQAEIGIKKLIELYGSPLVSYRTINEYTEADFDVLSCVEKARNYNVGDFTEMTMKIGESDVVEDLVLFAKGEGNYNHSYIKLFPESNSALVSMRRGANRKEFELCSDHLFSILLHTGWFELKVAKTLSEIKGVSTVWLNCEFQYSEGNPKNEIDIIAKYNNRMIFVECKTMIFHMTDIDKFRSAVRNFGGTGNIGIFATYNAPNNEKQKTLFNQALEKCKDNNILTFNYGLNKQKPEENPSIEDILNNITKTQNKR